MSKRHLVLVREEQAGKSGTGPPSEEALANLSDEALLAEFRSGRDAAFAALYRRYQSRLLLYLRSMISSRELADEVYNTTMFRVYTRMPDHLAPGQFKRYLYRAAHNTCLNACRREKNLRRQPPDGRTWGGALHEGAEGVDPEERLSQGQLLNLAQNFLHALPEDRRSALLLYHNESMSYQEIAEVLERPIGTVRWLIHEARAALALHLDRHVSTND